MLCFRVRWEPRRPVTNAGTKRAVDASAAAAWRQHVVQRTKTREKFDRPEIIRSALRCRQRVRCARCSTRRHVMSHAEYNANPGDARSAAPSVPSATCYEGPTRQRSSPSLRKQRVLRDRGRRNTARCFLWLDSQRSWWWGIAPTRRFSRRTGANARRTSTPPGCYVIPSARATPPVGVTSP